MTKLPQDMSIHIDERVPAPNERIQVEYGTRTGIAQSREEETGIDSASEQTDHGFMRFEQPNLQFLPGIPDDVTEALIIPKLSWRIIRKLSLQSCAWKSRLDARVRSLATEKKVLVERFWVPLEKGAVRLFSMADGFTYRLPSIPNIGTGLRFRQGCEFVFLDGKVYAIGGEQYNGNALVPSDEVYMLDLARQRKWEQCKSMQYARRWYYPGLRSREVNCSCGKIYVSGGKDCDRGYYIMEVYDTESNTWDQIQREPGAYDVTEVNGTEFIAWDQIKRDLAEILFHTAPGVLEAEVAFCELARLAYRIQTLLTKKLSKEKFALPSQSTSVEDAPLEILRLVCEDLNLPMKGTNHVAASLHSRLLAFVE